MSDAALGILKGCLIALVYLFLLRVVFLVASELRGTPGLGRAPAPAGGPRPRRAAKELKASQRRSSSPATTAKGWRLVVTEPAGARGTAFPVTTELTIGRGGGCGIALPGDTYVSTVHARAFSVDGDLWIEDLDSTNGTLVNGAKLDAPVRLKPGDHIKVGSTVLEAAK